MTGGGAGERWRRPVRDPRGWRRPRSCCPWPTGRPSGPVIPLPRRRPARRRSPAVLPPGRRPWPPAGRPRRIGAAAGAARRAGWPPRCGRPPPPAAATRRGPGGGHRPRRLRLPRPERGGAGRLGRRPGPDGSFDGAAVHRGDASVALDRHWRLARDTALAGRRGRAAAEAVQWIERPSGRPRPTRPACCPRPGPTPAPVRPGRFATTCGRSPGCGLAPASWTGAGQPEAAADARFADRPVGDVEAALDQRRRAPGHPCRPRRPRPSPGRPGPGATALRAARPPERPPLAATAERRAPSRAPGDGRAVLDPPPAGQPGPDPAARRGGAAGRATAAPRPAGLAARRRHPHVDLAHASTPAGRRVRRRRPRPAVAAGAARRSSVTCWSGRATAARRWRRWCRTAGTAGAGRSTARPRRRGRVLRGALARRPGRLLWEVEPHPGAEPVRLTAPGWTPAGRPPTPGARRCWARARRPPEDRPATPAGLRGGAGAPPPTRQEEGPRSRERAAPAASDPRRWGPTPSGRCGRCCAAGLHGRGAGRAEREGTLPLLAVERLIVPSAPVRPGHRHRPHRAAGRAGRPAVADARLPGAAAGRGGLHRRRPRDPGPRSGSSWPATWPPPTWSCS